MIFHHHRRGTGGGKISRGQRIIVGVMFAAVGLLLLAELVALVVVLVCF